MENELAKSKKERDDAEMARKYGEERFHKFKASAREESVASKKLVTDKDKTVAKLRADLRRNESVVDQKIKELKLVQTKALQDKQRR